MVSVLNLDWAQNLLSFAIVLGAVIAGLGYAIGQFRGGGNKAAAELAETLKSENEEYRRKIDALQHDLDQLKGRLESAEEDRKRLRELVMGERVPEALSNALQSIVDANVEALKEVSRQGIEEHRAANERHLNIVVGLLEAMEHEYLMPMKKMIERRKATGRDYDGPERRTNGGGKS